jgi:hypothetical protein
LFTVFFFDKAIEFQGIVFAGVTHIVDDQIVMSDF